MAQLAQNALQQLHDLHLISQKRSRLEEEGGQEEEEKERNLKLEVTDLGRAVFKGDFFFFHKH